MYTCDIGYGPFGSTVPCDQLGQHGGEVIVSEAAAIRATNQQQREQRHRVTQRTRAHAAAARRRHHEAAARARGRTSDRRQRMRLRAQQLRQQGYANNEAEWYANQEMANYPEDYDPYMGSYTGETADGTYVGDNAIGMGPTLPFEVGGQPTTTIDSEDELAPGTGPGLWQQGVPFMQQEPVGVPMPVVLGGLAAIALGIALLK